MAWCARSRCACLATTVSSQPLSTNCGAAVVSNDRPYRETPVSWLARTSKSMLGTASCSPPVDCSWLFGQHHLDTVDGGVEGFVYPAIDSVCPSGVDVGRSVVDEDSGWRATYVPEKLAEEA